LAGPALSCPSCGVEWSCTNGVWDFLTPDQAGRFDPFLSEYSVVRHAEGRGSSDPAWYRALPVVAPSDPLAWQWRIRAHSFEAFRSQGLPALGAAPRRIVDVGAGNGWLSYRLAQLGHQPAAVDLWADDRDGLGALVRYAADLEIPALRADFDHLPLPDGIADAVVFNASLHYSRDYAVTLGEALRVLTRDGTVVVMDSPIYRHDDSGRAMVAERRQAFAESYGFPSDVLGSREYFTEAELRGLGEELGLRWRRIQPWYGLAWALRPWRARLHRRREPARFALLVGQRRARS
jgi:SAM-dependent methyltransferase